MICKQNKQTSCEDISCQSSRRTMGRELQKRKNRTKVPKLKKKSKSKLLRNGRKKVDVLGNALIAENW
jgi:hypothetical protein